MLFLQLKDKEYLTIGDDIVIQVFTNATIQVSVQAPRELSVLRGEVLERNGSQRPRAVLDKSPEQARKAQKRQKPKQNSVSNG